MQIGINYIYILGTNIQNLRKENNKILYFHNGENKEITLPFENNTIHTQNSLVLSSSVNQIVSDSKTYYLNLKRNRKDDKDFLKGFFKFYNIDIKQVTLFVNEVTIPFESIFLNEKKFEKYDHIKLNQLSAEDNKALLQLRYINVIDKIPIKRKTFETNKYNIEILNEIRERVIIRENVMLNPGISFAVWNGYGYYIWNTSSFIRNAILKDANNFNIHAINNFLKFIQTYKSAINIKTN